MPMLCLQVGGVAKGGEGLERVEGACPHCLGAACQCVLAPWAFVGPVVTGEIAAHTVFTPVISKTGISRLFPRANMKKIHSTQADARNPKHNPPLTPWSTQTAEPWSTQKGRREGPVP